VQPHVPAAGLLPYRIAADFLAGREDPGAIGQMIADALRSVFDYPSAMVSAIAPYAAAYGLRRGDGLGLLRWLLYLSGDPEREVWLAEAAASDPRSSGSVSGAEDGPKSI
jgi:hypothetical protein